MDAIITTSVTLAEEHEKSIGVGPKMDSEYSCRSRLANTVSQGYLIFSFSKFEISYKFDCYKKNSECIN